LDSKGILVFPSLEGFIHLKNIFSFFNQEIILENFYVSLDKNKILNKFAVKELSNYIRNTK